MKAKRWAKAVLQISSKTLTVEEISAKLNTQPTKYFAKGEPNGKEDSETQKREENLWVLKSGVPVQERLEPHINYFLSFLKENSDAVTELQPDCEFEFVCSYASKNGQGGFTFFCEEMKALAAFPVKLSVGLYPPKPFEDE